MKELIKDEETYLKIKESDNLLFKALELVTIIFQDKVDKGGYPYSIHLLTVYSRVDDYMEKVCALLHDIVEDSDVTVEELKEIGFTDEIVEIVNILTKKKGEVYTDYIDRIIKSGNVHAMNIKLADLSHNMETDRIKNPTVEDFDRLHKKYEPAYNKILNKLNNK